MESNIHMYKIQIKSTNAVQLVTDYVLAGDVAFSACSEDITKKIFRERKTIWPSV